MLDSGKLRGFAPGEGVVAGAFAERFDSRNWIDVSAPGDVHRALMAAGWIEDPFYDRNEERCAWVEVREWWYRLSFDGPLEPPRPDERLLLVFHGLDTFATVWLNDAELGRHRSMFLEAVFDVSGRVRAEEPNILALCFDRPLDHAGAGTPDQWGRDPERAAIRKAQCGFGWDWGPRLPTIGIWRLVELRRERRAAIRGVHFYTLKIDRSDNRTLVAVRVEVERFATVEPLTAAIALSPAPGAEPVAAHTLTLESKETHLEGKAYLVVENPRLWWTHDLGEPALYDLRVSLGEDGAYLAHHRSLVGNRTLELDQSPDPAERGTRFFRFVLNSAPIFARGANWVLADSSVGAIEKGRYEKLLGAAREANINMVRVWGGIYEHDAFYDLCDRLGLLVWQDFMFACATYPEEPL
jgi:beta-mannosidase